MAYTTESEVYDTTGLSSSVIQNLSGKSAAEVTTLVTEYIAKAEQKLKEDIDHPFIITRELHLGDGNKNIFNLGPEDDEFGYIYENENIANNVIKVFDCWFGDYKKFDPWPTDCELGTDATTGWTGSNATISADSDEAVHGDNAIKCVFSASGYVQYPDGSNVEYLDKIVDSWGDLFFYARISDATATITVRIYDKDGNYSEETVTLRQNNIGQYIWLDLDSFTNPLDWDDVRVQYIRFYVDKACTLYLDNLCFADEWAFSAPSGLLHISVADNITSDSPPSYGYPFYVSYSYDPFLSSVPRNIKEAVEWLTGVYIIDYLRGIRYMQTSFEVEAETLEMDRDSSREALLGVRTYMMKNYWHCLRNYGPGAYGVV